MNYFDFENKNYINPDNQIIRNKWIDIIGVNYISCKLASKIDKLSIYIMDNFYNRRIFKNSRLLIASCFDVFYALYERNNNIDEIKFIHNYDQFITKNKKIFYGLDFEMKVLYMNIFIEIN